LKKLIIFIAIAIISLNGCKKENDAGKILDEEFKLSQNASLNVEIKNLKESLKSAKDDYERSVIHTKIASIESEKGNVTSSIKSAQEAIKFQPNQYMSHYLLGKSYIESGRYDDAMSELNISIELNSKFAPSHFELGNACYKKFKYREAVAEYGLAIKFDSKHFQSYNNMGVILSILGKERESEAAFKNVILINPAFPAVYKNLGILYDTKLKNKPLAAVNYKKFLELAPNCPERSAVKMWLSVLGV